MFSTGHKRFTRQALLCPISRLALLLFATTFLANSLPAQTENPKPPPYATLDRQAVTYRGPISGAEEETPGQTAAIGLIVPLQGAQKAQGDAIQAAARIALEEEQSRGPLPDGRKLSLVVRDESGPWGQASREVLDLIEQDHAVAVLTSADGNIAHQAEQLANKISFPILTLASDASTTETNIPWIFRLGPSDSDQARAIADRIYKDLKLRNVLLIAQPDHDGRMGAAEFEKAANHLNMPASKRLDLATSPNAITSARDAIRSSQADAVVMWTDANTARNLLPVIREALPSPPVFLSSKAAQLGAQGLPQVFTAVFASAKDRADQARFTQMYSVRTGTTPSFTAFLAYQGVRVMAAGLRNAGANRALLRNYLAHENEARDAVPLINFDPAGNCLNKFALIEIPLASANIASK